MARGDLIAYADDIVVLSQNLAMMETILAAMEDLEKTFGLKLNKKKTVFLSKKKDYEHIDEIRGIRRASKVKYLGIMISTDLSQIVKDAKSSVRRNVAVIRSRLRTLSIESKEQVMLSFVRSLLIYFTTPLVGAKLMHLSDVEKIEREYYREIMNLPRDIKREVIVNVAS